MELNLYIYQLIVWMSFVLIVSSSYQRSFETTGKRRVQSSERQMRPHWMGCHQRWNVECATLATLSLTHTPLCWFIGHFLRWPFLAAWQSVCQHILDCVMTLTYSWRGKAFHLGEHTHTLPSLYKQVILHTYSHRIDRLFRLIKQSVFRKFLIKGIVVKLIVIQWCSYRLNAWSSGD